MCIVCVCVRVAGWVVMVKLLLLLLVVVVVVVVCACVRACVHVLRAEKQRAESIASWPLVGTLHAVPYSKWLRRDLFPALASENSELPAAARRALMLVSPGAAERSVRFDDADTIGALKRRLRHVVEYLPSEMEVSWEGRPLSDEIRVIEVVPEGGRVTVMKRPAAAARGSALDNYVVGNSCPILMQSRDAMATMFAVLMVQVSESSRDAIVGRVYQILPSPPFCVALHALYEQNILSSAQRIALVEGMAQLFGRIVPFAAADVAPGACNDAHFALLLVRYADDIYVRVQWACRTHC